TGVSPVQPGGDARLSTWIASSNDHAVAAIVVSPKTAPTGFSEWLAQFSPESFPSPTLPASQTTAERSCVRKRRLGSAETFVRVLRPGPERRRAGLGPAGR